MDKEKRAKELKAEYLKNYYQNNKDRLNAYQRQYRANNKDKVKQYNKTYWLKKASLIQEIRRLVKVAKASIKTLNEVMRNPKIYAQNKGII